ncbi:MAG: general secretion pathway protein GspB [Ramlibacter sp.]|nr:general secretion pathway protein GspB [Ramlibacter sp.]
MSYILDALRKADAQRARDSARGISAQGNRPLADTSTSSRMRPWYLGVAAIAVAAIGWGGWAFYSVIPEVREARQIAKAQKAEVEEIVAVAPVINAGPQREPQPGEPIRMPMMAPMAPVVGSGVRPAPPEPPAVVAQQEIGPRPSARSVERARQPGNGEPSGAVPMSPSGHQPPPSMDLPQATTQPLPIAPGPAMPQQPVAANAPPAPPVAGLPSDAPKLSISGGVYSANRAQRMLIVNGQVFNEGSEISSGVVLEEVKPKIAVLRFKGTRYTVTY